MYVAGAAAEAGYSGANSRRSSTAEFQERPPMSFASGAGGSRRGSRQTLGSKQHREADAKFDVYYLAGILYRVIHKLPTTSL